MALSVAGARAQAESSAFDWSVGWGLHPNWCAYDHPAAKVPEDGACPLPRNPQDLPDELILPLPCGRAMVFSKVSMPADSILDHVVGEFGSASNASEDNIMPTMSYGPWSEAVVGGYTERAPSQSGNISRSFYMSTYEVTKPQMDLVASALVERGVDTLSREAEACADVARGFQRIRRRSLVPATQQSWFDAVTFVRAYGNWLMDVDRSRIERGYLPLVPWEDGSPGNIRLATEAEWELAARGGSHRVSAAERAQRFPRVLDPNTGAARQVSGPNEIAVFGLSAQEGFVGPVGTRLPNEAGLYDIVGNAEEIVMDPFRLTRPDGRHGQVGGYILRGGVPTNERSIGVGVRREMPYFDAYGETRSAAGGLRLVLSAVALPWGAKEGRRFQQGFQNPERQDALKDARNKILQGTSAESRQASELATEIEELVSATAARAGGGASDNPDTVAQVLSVRRAVDKLRAELADRDRSVARERLKSAIMINFSIRSIGRQMFVALQQLEELIAERNKLPRGDIRRAQIQSVLDSTKSRFQILKDYQYANLRLYAEIVLQLTDLTDDSLVRASETVVVGFIADQLNLFSEFSNLLVEQVRATRLNNSVAAASMIDQWLFDIDVVRARRATRFSGTLNELGVDP